MSFTRDGEKYNLIFVEACSYAQHYLILLIFNTNVDIQFWSENRSACANVIRMLHYLIGRTDIRAHPYAYMYINPK